MARHDRIVWHDLPARGAALIDRVRQALRDGRLQVAHVQAAAVERELNALQRIFASTAEDGIDSTPSILPATWLEARWRTLFAAKSPWYASLERGISLVPEADDLQGNLIVQYLAFRGMGRDKELPPSLVKTARQWLQQTKLDRAQRDMLERLSGEPDPLMELESVRRGRVETLRKKYQKLMDDMRLPGYTPTFSHYAKANESALMHCENEARVVLDFERMKFALDVQWQEDHNGTRVSIQGVRGVDFHSAAMFVHLQRACVLALSMLYGERWPDLDQRRINYLHVDRDLSKKGLDESSGNGARQNPSPRALFDAMQAHLNARGAKPLWSKSKASIRGWQVRPSRLFGLLRGAPRTILAAEQFSDEAWPHFQEALDADGDEMLLLFGNTDGPTLRRLQKQMLGSKWAVCDLGDCPNFACAALSVDACCGGSVQLLKELFEAADLPGPTASKDFALALAPQFTLLDPLFGMCWLALQSLKYAKTMVW